MARKGKLKEKTKDVLERPKSIRHYRELIMIVCEDEGKEPYYFNKFKEEFERILPYDTVMLVPIGSGRNSLGVVRQAVEEKQSSFENHRKVVDEVWAVFDKDDLDKQPKTRENFKKAFEEAAVNGIKIAYSNECFELWLLLHLTEIDSETAIPRHSKPEEGIIGLYERLENLINKGRTPETQFKYNHGDKDIVDVILASGNEDQAINRARSLDEKQKDKDPIEANPNTKVYLLVSHLRELLAWYQSGIK